MKTYLLERLANLAGKGFYQPQDALAKGAAVFFGEMKGRSFFTRFLGGRNLTEGEVLNRIQRIGLAGDNEEAKGLLDDIVSNSFDVPSFFGLTTATCHLGKLYDSDGNVRYAVMYEVSD